MPTINEQVGPYTLTRYLGRGGFGDVWQAVERTAFSSNDFALKFVRPDGTNGVDLDAVRAEVEKWKQACGHPNIMPFIKADIYGGHIVIVSEYADGGSLGSWLKQHGGRAPSVTEAARMARGILRGVDHLHGRKLLHRDLKPENVMLQGGHPRLIDFGISGVLSTRTDTKTLSGTLPYMPPEAFKKKKSEHTDIWAVGVMLYQMLAGRLPFDGGDDFATMYQIINEKPDALPSNIPAAMCAIVLKALEKKREDRYQTAMQMLTDLEQAMYPPPQVPTVIIPPTVIMPSVVQTPPPAPRIIPPPQPAIVRPRLPDKPSLPRTDTFMLPGGVSLEMVLIPAGKFMMGSNNGGIGEKPVHKVTIRRPFYLGKYQVTQAQWNAVMNDGVALPVEAKSVFWARVTGNAPEQTQRAADNNPSYFKGDNLPVENVSWEEVQQFCRKLGPEYRLPMEAEWEYVCRAGTTVDYAGKLDEMAWYRNNSDSKTHPVGQKKPNDWGLYDMHGNVWEWCADWYSSYSSNAETDPCGPDTGSVRVYRGGGWFSTAVYARSAARNSHAPGYRNKYLGFRLAKTPM